MIMEVSWIEDGKAQIGDGVARGFKHGNKVIQRYILGVGDGALFIRDDFEYGAKIGHCPKVRVVGEVNEGALVI